MWPSQGRDRGSTPLTRTKVFKLARISGIITLVQMAWARSEEAYHASLSRRRSPVRIRSGPPSNTIDTLVLLLYNVYYELHA